MAFGSPFSSRGRRRRHHGNWVGGILANDTYLADFLSETSKCWMPPCGARVPRLPFLGLSCIYPKPPRVPIPESALPVRWSRPTTRTRSPKSPASQVQAVRRQHGLPISAMPTNLYAGPGDNFAVRLASAAGTHSKPL